MSEKSEAWLEANYKGNRQGINFYLLAKMLADFAESVLSAHAASTDRLREALNLWDCPDDACDNGKYFDGYDADENEILRDCETCHGSGLHPTAMSALEETSE